MVSLVQKRIHLWALCFFALMLVSGLSACGSSSPTPPPAADLMTESDEPLTRSRAKKHLTLAVMYFNDGKATIALDSVKQAIAVDPTWFESFNFRGLVYMRLNDAPLAEDSFKRALVLNPKAGGVKHNYATLMCSQSRLADAVAMFNDALATPGYLERAKTWMAMGLCQMQAGKLKDAEASFLHSYELDAANPFTGYNLAVLMYGREDYVRAQFYIRRINNSEAANSESLWLGMKVERKLANTDGLAQLAVQLKKRFPQSREMLAYERGAFDE